MQADVHTYTETDRQGENSTFTPAANQSKHIEQLNHKQNLGGQQR